jgi:hypothetical protein
VSAGLAATFPAAELGGMAPIQLEPVLPCCPPVIHLLCACYPPVLCALAVFGQRTENKRFSVDYFRQNRPGTAKNGDNSEKQGEKPEIGA